MGFRESTLKHISQDGIRKSKTLLAIHMSGNLSSPELLNKMRSWLKVIHTTQDDINPYEKLNDTKLHKFDNLLHVRALGHMKDEFKD